MTRSRDLHPGQSIRHRSGDPRVLRRRKDSDDGWWLDDGSGIADWVLDQADAWTIVDGPSYVYVASSWRNPMQPAVIQTLRAAGIDCYDFRNPPTGTGFSWREVEPVGAERIAADTVGAKGSDWRPVADYLAMVEHPRAVEGFRSDFDAMQRADAFVLVLPCGKSAHLELGWAIGAGKRTAILLEDPVEPELMYRMADYLAPSMFDLLGWLGVED